MRSKRNLIQIWLPYAAMSWNRWFPLRNSGQSGLMSISRPTPMLNRITRFSNNFYHFGILQKGLTVSKSHR